MNRIACVINYPNHTGWDRVDGAFFVHSPDGSALGFVERGWPSPGPLWYAHDKHTGRRHGRPTIDEAVALLLILDAERADRP